MQIVKVNERRWHCKSLFPFLRYNEKRIRLRQVRARRELNSIFRHLRNFFFVFFFLSFFSTHYCALGRTGRYFSSFSACIIKNIVHPRCATATSDDDAIVRRLRVSTRTHFANVKIIVVFGKRKLSVTVIVRLSFDQNAKSTRPSHSNL